MDTAIQVRRPWNKGIMVGQKRPLLARRVWSIHVPLEMSASARDLALFPGVRSLCFGWAPLAMVRSP